MAEMTTDKALESLLSSVRLDATSKSYVPMIRNNFKEVEDKVPAEDRFVSSLAALLYNLDGDKAGGKFEKGKVLDLLSQVDGLINTQMNEILHHPTFQSMESVWRGLDDLVQNTNFRANVAIDILDVEKDELYQDFENNSSNVFGGALFEKIYIKEYDQYGGRPYGALIGQYDFEQTPRDLFWRRASMTVREGPEGDVYIPVIYDCADPALSDTLKQAEDGRVQRTLPRGDKWAAQTPQMFRLGLLAQALQQAGHQVTDEASAIEALGLQPLLVPGEWENLKVTWPADLALAERLLAAR